MTQIDFLEEYFIKISKSYGIHRLDFEENRVKLEDKFIRNMVFASDDFNDEFDNLLAHCQLLYQEIQRGYSLKIKRDINNNYMVFLI